MASARKFKKQKHKEVCELNKEEKIVAKYLRFKMPTKEGKITGSTVPYFSATEAIEYLLKSKYSSAVSGKRTTSRPNEILISSRHHAFQFWEKLFHAGLFMRCSKVKKIRDEPSSKHKSRRSEEDNKARKRRSPEKEGEDEDEEDDSSAERRRKEKDEKKALRKIKLEPHEEQLFVEDDDGVYVWQFDPTNSRTLTLGGLVVRYVLWFACWACTAGKLDVWVLPNLDAPDLGFFESFKPAYTVEWRSSKKVPKPKKGELAVKAASLTKNASEEEEEEGQRAAGAGHGAGHGEGAGEGEDEGEGEGEARDGEGEAEAGGEGEPLSKSAKRRLKQTAKQEKRRELEQALSKLRGSDDATGDRGEAEGRPAEKLSKKKRREQKRRELELLEGDDLDDGDGNEPASFLPPQTAGESESAHKGSGSGGGAAAAGEAEARDSSGDSSTEAAAGFELVDR